MNDESKLVKHYINRSNWLRAAVLGANDGILSTASIVIGVAAASELREPIVLAGLAGLVAGALSMAAGEYVSVSSQTDIEEADIERERKELIEIPEIELRELTKIYQNRGVKKETALEVAKQLTAYNALEAHARDELGINEANKANPIQAALSSAAAFTFGAVLPLVVAIFFPIKQMVYYQYGFSIIFLMILGALAAKAGGSSISKAVIRITVLGTVAMVLTALVGYLFGVNV